MAHRTGTCRPCIWESLHAKSTDGIYLRNLRNRQGYGLVKLGELDPRGAPGERAVPCVHDPETPLRAPTHGFILMKQNDREQA